MLSSLALTYSTSGINENPLASEVLLSDIQFMRARAKYCFKT
jgi:hypothetical protein